jgi:hypothetical protein
VPDSSPLQTSATAVGGGSLAENTERVEPEKDLMVQEYFAPSSADSADGSSTVNSSKTDQRSIPPIWPSVITGILFGLMHIGYGMSFIPLSALGVFLGLIYRQTHSVWPCIIIHMMLNGFSMLMLAQLILLKNATT